jgi:hypothetical protein
VDALKPDFSIIERTWVERLRQRGLSPSAVGQGIATGYDRLELYRQETQVAEYEIDGAVGHGFLASMEVKVAIAAPSLGEHEVLELITQHGESLESALANCANTFMDVTLPPLEALFTNIKPTGPGTGKVTLTSYSPGLDRGIKWDVILGQLQILNDADGSLSERLKEKLPVTLMLNTLTGFLHEPRLHWCKLYGAMTAKAGLTFGCAIDGQKCADGEAEMAERFGGPLPGDWEFRQFMVVRSIGDADEEMTKKLRAMYAESCGGEKKSWWSRLLGR